MHGQTYYFNVRAENGAGLLASIASSNGQTVDTTCVTSSAFIITSTSENISIYPIPAHQQIFVVGLKSEELIELYDMNGKKILQTKSKIIDVKDISDGIYILKIITQNNVYESKIIIQH